MDRYITKCSIEGLVSKLGLPPMDEYSQDWEYEIASSDIAIKLVNDYKNRVDLTEDEKFTLMHVMLESINDFFSINGDSFPLIEEFKEIALKDYSTHSPTFDDWACWEQSDVNDAFELTPIIRDIIKLTESKI